MNWNASEVERFCECRWLENASTNPSFPIEFDDVANEYQVILDGDEKEKGFAVIRFCPFCGCRAPESIRGTHFAEPDPAEIEKLVELVDGATTFQDIVRRLGQPTEEGSADPTNWMPRVLFYNELFSTIEVLCEGTLNGPVSVQFYGKYIGPKRGVG